MAFQPWFRRSAKGQQPLQMAGPASHSNQMDAFPLFQLLLKTSLSFGSSPGGRLQNGTLVSRPSLSNASQSPRAAPAASTDAPALWFWLCERLIYPFATLNSPSERLMVAAAVGQTQP